MQPLKFSFSLSSKFEGRANTHIFLLEMPQTDEEILRLYFPILSSQEKERAQEYALNKPRNQFIISKAFTRLLLAKALDTLPEDLEFEYNSFGKPSLAHKHSSPFSFNISHSANIFMLGISFEGEIGVDIEIARKNIKVFDLAKHAFAQEEVEILKGTRREWLEKTFYRIWAGKESLIKAVGSGISFGLDNFVLNFRDNDEVFIQEIKNSAYSISDFEIVDLSHYCETHPFFTNANDAEKPLNLGASVVIYRKRH